MSIADYASLQAKVAAPWQRLCLTKGSTPGVFSGQLCSLWTLAPFAGAAPTTAAAPTKATAGAIAQLFDSSGTQRLAQSILNNSDGSTYGGGAAILVDRLSHQGGLSGTTAGSQTTNLPTAALTRYTDGVGVIAALEIYTAVGATATTATISYTNQAGTSGRTSQAAAFGNSGNMEALRLIPMTLAAGDSGVRAVASVSLNATTGTVGSFGVTLYKPLMIFPLVHYAQSERVFDGMLEMFGQMPQILPGACLSWLFVPFNTTSGAFSAELKLIEE